MKTLYISSITFWIGFVVALLIGWKVWSNKPAERFIEYRPAIEHSNGSVTAEVKPNSKAPVKTAVPKGNKPSETITIVVRDTIVRFVDCPDGTLVRCPDCPDDTLNMTVSDGANGKRVTAKVSGGKVIEQFVDVPMFVRVEPTRAAGLSMSYTFIETAPSIGLFYQRAVGPVVVGMRVEKQLYDHYGLQFGAQFGIRF